MKQRTPYTLPQAQKEQIEKAKKLEWATIFFLSTIILVMFLTMGSSQAMRTAWIEDVLSLVPPIVFLVAMRSHDREPDKRFPYGWRSVSTISFLSAATAVLLLGLYMLYEAARALIMMEHPTIGMMNLFGWEVWSGWVMIAALTYSAIPPVVLGKMKLTMAEKLHAKTLHADAAMNKADWSTAVAAIVGILGVGLGFWWADAAAAGLIALDVTRDGITNVRHAISDLLNQRPTQINSNEPDPLIEQMKAKLSETAWVKELDVRLREEGLLLAGEVYVVPEEEDDLVQKMEALRQTAVDMHWRVYDVVVTAVSSL